MRLEQAQGWKMLHSVEKKKVAQLEAEVTNLKVTLELIREATNKVLGRLLPDWKQVKVKINQLIADRWDNHSQNPDRKKTSQQQSFNSGPQSS